MRGRAAPPHQGIYRVPPGNKTPIKLDQLCMKGKRKTTRVSEGSSYRGRLQNLICPIKN